MKKMALIAALPVLFMATPVISQEMVKAPADAMAKEEMAKAEMAKEEMAKEEMKAAEMKAAEMKAAEMKAAEMAKPAAAPATGKVIFFRKGGLFGAAISCAVFENGVKVSSLSPGKYFEINAAEGIHQYSVRSEATDTLRIEVEAGETYYNECSIGLGVVAGRPNLAPVDEARWNEKKAKLKLAKKEVPKAEKKK
jgi:hypothetical protein